MKLSLKSLGSSFATASRFDLGRDCPICLKGSYKLHFGITYLAVSHQDSLTLSEENPLTSAPLNVHLVITWITFWTVPEETYHFFLSTISSAIPSQASLITDICQVSRVMALHTAVTSWLAYRALSKKLTDSFRPKEVKQVVTLGDSAERLP